jgi:glucose/arabinose dehydrogenase
MPGLRVLVGCLLLGTALTSGAALAQENLNRLQDFRTTGTDLTLKTVPQDPAKLAQLRKNLEKVKLPPGFKIDVYAIVPDARHMAVGRNVGAVFVGTRKTDVWAVTDRDKDRNAEEVKRFAPSVNFKIPNGMCMSPDGILYVAEHNRLLAFPAVEFFYEGPDVAVQVVKEQFIPKEDEHFNHGARVCTIGPDNKLYLSMGQPYNVWPHEKGPKMDPYGSIQRMNRDGSSQETYARGIRNSVGIAFNPADKMLWFTDNQVDGMGDDTPPGELNRVTQPGQNYGHPWYGGGKVRTEDWSKDEPPADVVMPEVEMDAHAADLGLTFYNGNMFPAQYKGGIFSAQHGSWNRTTPVGARIMFTRVGPDGKAAGTEVFASGLLDESTGEFLGRPVDVQQYLDGSLLVSDDTAGAIYRISYQAQ